MNVTIKGYSEGGNWYKGNLHCHTTDSDGKLTPSEVVELYRSAGYDFLAISDHNIFSDYRKQFDDETFIILPAMEASAALFEDESRKNLRKVHHIHGILGSEEMQKQAEKELFSHLQRYPER